MLLLSMHSAFSLKRKVESAVYSRPIALPWVIKDVSLPVETKLLIVACAGSIFFSANAFAFETNGDLDPSFAAKFTNGQVQTMVMQPDGKLVIAGAFSKVNGVARRNIARLNANGSLDTSFDAAGSTDATITQLIRQTDGAFIIVGGMTNGAGGTQFGFVNGTLRNNIARLNSNGSLDMSFDPGALICSDTAVSGGVAVNPGEVDAAVLQSDGKIVIVGIYAAVANGPTTSAPRSCIARFNSDGSFDSTYNPGAGLTNPSGTQDGLYVVRQSNDKVIVNGIFTQFDGNPVPGFVRVNTNGSYDATFNVGMATGDPTSVTGIYVQSDDQIMVFGSFAAWNGFGRNSILRLGVNGALDPNFATNIFRNYNGRANIEACIQQPDGNYLVGGLFYSYDGNPVGGIARFDSFGNPDFSFDVTGTKLAGEVTCFAIRTTDDEYFVGGYFSTYGPDARNNLVLIKTDGTNDPALPLTTGVSDFSPQIFAISPQTDGKVIVGGLFSSVNGQPRYNLVRLNSDGSTDSSFQTINGASRSVRAFVRQSSGKLLVVGNFYAIDGVAKSGVARLNNDGSLDGSFDPGIGPNVNSLSAAAVDASDNVYIGGSFSSFNTVTRPNFVKLGPNGAVDLAFNTGVGTAGTPPTVSAVAPPTATAGVVIGGSFTLYNGSTANRIARVNDTTAALDTPFTANGGSAFNINGNVVRALTLRSDGSYYAAGSFTAFNGTTRQRLLHLNSNGSLDTGFANPALSATARALAEQNNKIVVGGNFTSPANQIARYATNGTRDTTLVTGTGLTNTEYAAITTPEVDVVAVQPDGRLLIGGIFSAYQGVPRFSLARLFNAHLRILTIAPFSGHIHITGSGDPSTAYSFQAAIDPNAGSFSEIAMVTTDPSGNWFYDDLNSPVNVTRRFYRAAFY